MRLDRIENDMKIAGVNKGGIGAEHCGGVWDNDNGG